jgi:hypothetical protein
MGNLLEIIVLGLFSVAYATALTIWPIQSIVLCKTSWTDMFPTEFPLVTAFTSPNTNLTLYPRKRRVAITLFFNDSTQYVEQLAPPMFYVSPVQLTSKTRKCRVKKSDAPVDVVVFRRSTIVAPRGMAIGLYVCLALSLDQGRSQR